MTSVSYLDSTEKATPTVTGPCALQASRIAGLTGARDSSAAAAEWVLKSFRSGG